MFKASELLRTVACTWRGCIGCMASLLCRFWTTVGLLDLFFLWFFSYLAKSKTCNSSGRRATELTANIGRSTLRWSSQTSSMWKMPWKPTRSPIDGNGFVQVQDWPGGRPIKWAGCGDGHTCPVWQDANQSLIALSRREMRPSAWQAPQYENGVGMMVCSAYGHCPGLPQAFAATVSPTEKTRLGRRMRIPFARQETLWPSDSTWAEKNNRNFDTSQLNCDWGSNMLWSNTETLKPEHCEIKPQQGNMKISMNVTEGEPRIQVPKVGTIDEEHDETEYAKTRWAPAAGMQGHELCSGFRGFPWTMQVGTRGCYWHRELIDQAEGNSLCVCVQTVAKCGHAARLVANSERTKWGDGCRRVSQEQDQETLPQQAGLTSSKQSWTPAIWNHVEDRLAQVHGASEFRFVGISLSPAGLETQG